jgi:YD repeat-containing protein
VTKVTTPDGAVTNNGYDHVGELASAADAYGNTTSYSYNHLGQVAQVTSPDTSFTQYGHDPAGNLTGVADYSTAPPGQAAQLLRSETFGYDPDGNLASVKDGEARSSHPNPDRHPPSPAATSPKPLRRKPPPAAVTSAEAAAATHPPTPPAPANQEVTSMASSRYGTGQGTQQGYLSRVGRSNCSPVATTKRLELPLTRQMRS